MKIPAFAALILVSQCFAVGLLRETNQFSEFISNFSHSLLQVSMEVFSSKSHQQVPLFYQELAKFLDNPHGQANVEEAKRALWSSMAKHPETPLLPFLMSREAGSLRYQIEKRLRKYLQDQEVDKVGVRKERIEPTIRKNLWGSDRGLMVGLAQALGRGFHTQDNPNALLVELQYFLIVDIFEKQDNISLIDKLYIEMNRQQEATSSGNQDLSSASGSTTPDSGYSLMDERDECSSATTTSESQLDSSSEPEESEIEGSSAISNSLSDSDSDYEPGSPGTKRPRRDSKQTSKKSKYYHDPDYYGPISDAPQREIQTRSKNK